MHIKPWILIFAVIFGARGLCVVGDACAQSFPNIRISDPSLRYPEEVSIAINPQNPKQLAAGANLNYLFTSSDGGMNWNWRQLSSQYGFWGDPNLMFDDSGVLYYEHLSGTSWSDSEFLWRIVVQRSTDAGMTFDSGEQIGLYPPTMQDKAWLGLDRSQTVSKGTLFTSWNEDDKYGSRLPSDSSRIFFSQSTDRGLSWSNRVRVDDWGGDCIDSSGTVEGAVTTAGPNGSIYIVWSGHNKIFFDESSNGGKSFGPERAIADQPGGWDFVVPGIFRANGFPMIVSDLNPASPFYGRLYVMWSDQRRGVTDVYSIYSTDNGSTWSNPLRVNNDTSMNHHFFPTMMLDPVTGRVYIAFYDRRNYLDSQTDVYLARSTDGGGSFSNTRISQSAFGPDSGVFFGDYIHIAAYDHHIYPTWMRMDDSAMSVWTALVMDTGNALNPPPLGVEQPFSEAAGISSTGSPAEPGITFSTAESGPVEIELYDLLGRSVAVLINGTYGPGECHFGLPDHIPNGNYMAKLRSGGQQWVTKVFVDR
ncbi:MAG TPA: T9SS type A sorting domain-containing protein [Candidatus Kapabacteria bacterium]|nr:T9SS type A sorting domain-containing protein [Candidatus Kapabacteria bacterium]